MRRRACVTASTVSEKLLASTFGRGAMTNTFVDIQHADMIMVMGGNAAEAHPVGFKWVIEAKKEKRHQIICG